MVACYIPELTPAWCVCGRWEEECKWRNNETDSEECERGEHSDPAWLHWPLPGVTRCLGGRVRGEEMLQHTETSSGYPGQLIN